MCGAYEPEGDWYEIQYRRSSPGQSACENRDCTTHSNTRRSPSDISPPHRQAPQAGSEGGYERSVSARIERRIAHMAGLDVHLEVGDRPVASAASVEGDPRQPGVQQGRVAGPWTRSLPAGRRRCTTRSTSAIGQRSATVPCSWPRREVKPSVPSSMRHSAASPGSVSVAPRWMLLRGDAQLRKAQRGGNHLRVAEQLQELVDDVGGQLRRDGVAGAEGAGGAHPEGRAPLDPQIATLVHVDVRRRA